MVEYKKNAAVLGKWYLETGTYLCTVDQCTKKRPTNHYRREHLSLDLLVQLELVHQSGDHRLEATHRRVNAQCEQHEEEQNGPEFGERQRADSFRVYLHRRRTS